MVLCNSATHEHAGSSFSTTAAAATAAASPRCYCWRLAHRYDFRAGGQARLRLQQHIDAPCTQPPTFVDFLLADLNALNLLVTLLAAAYLFLLGKAMAASVTVFLRARRSFAAHAAAAGTAGAAPHPLTDR